MQSIIHIIRACDNVQFCTAGLGDYPETRHLMNGMNRNISNLSALHFITFVDSPKFKQIQNNPHVCLYYFNPENRHVVRLFGLVSVIDDMNEKRKLWRDDYKAFGFTGADDINYTLLQFAPKWYKFYTGNELNEGAL